MQMLVYENYNKFISATETIKRMKINVEVMDEDMDHVKRKMESICAVSVELDNSLHNQRIKVSDHPS
jgi:vacuolar protein sorting-associated protein 51